MTGKKLERRKFLQFCSAAAIGSGLVVNPIQLLANENSKKKNIRFKLSKPRWIIYENGCYDLISEEIILKNCRPAFDGQGVMPKNVFLGDSPKGKRIVYELPGGFLMLDLKTNNNSISIGAEFSGFSQAPEWFFPISQAEVFGVKKFFKQGFGCGGQSGVFPINKTSRSNWKDSSDNLGWSHDSFLTFAFLGENETIAIGNLNQNDFLQRSTIYNRTHRFGLQDRNIGEEQVFFESAMLLEKIRIKNEYIKLPELHFFTGNKPFETFQELAWRTSEKTNARQGTVTSYHWISKKEKENSFNELKIQVDFLDSHNPALPLHTLMLNKGFCEIGDWLEPNDYWPGGINRVAREIFKDGYRAGIWIAPFVISEKSKVYKNHPDWIAKNYNNRPIVEEANEQTNLYALDISNHAVQKYLVRIFRSLRKMGFIFYELAYLNAGFKCNDEINRKNPGKSSVQLFREIMSLIRNEVGEGSLIMTSKSPYSPLIGFSDIMIIGSNNSNGWNESDIKNRIQESYFTHYFNNIFWQNNPGGIDFYDKNSLFTDNEIISLALWNGMLGGAVGFQNELLCLVSEKLDLIRFLAPSKRQKNAYLPFWPDPDEIKVAVRAYKKQQSWGILFFNDKDFPVERRFRIADLIEPETAYVFSWKPEAPISYGEQNEIMVILPPHQSRLFYLSENNVGAPANLTLGGRVLDE
ncbi:MAG: alpha-galactosidase [Draconibacterium sp.]|nr:alpha-galactosidase [Draconibacterium sp.]